MSDQQTSIEVLCFNPETDCIEICDLCQGNDSSEPYNKPCPIDGGVCKQDKPLELSNYR